MAQDQSGNNQVRWRTDLSRYEAEVRQFVRYANGLLARIRRASRDDVGPEEALGLLNAVQDWSDRGQPRLGSAGEWREYWEGRRRAEAIEFESALREQLARIEKDIRELTGEPWAIELTGSYPRYYVLGLKLDAVELRKKGLARAREQMKKRLLEVVSPRFKSERDFLECLWLAYRMAVAFEGTEAQPEPPYENRRQLHRFTVCVMNEKRIPGAARYPLEAFGIDLARCLIRRVTEVRGERLDLRETKYAGEGVRVEHPELGASRIYGRARFQRGG